MTKSPERARELDSLRGLAALAVLGYHVLASNSRVLTSGISLGEVHGRLANLLVYSPLHIVWLGAEPVWLFFVLSGFVLGRSALTPAFDWSAYYPSRLVRIYLPVVGAVGLAWLTYLAPHRLTPQMDQLLPTAYPWPNVLHDVTVVGGTSTSLGVLWSLQWEVVFSLLLPLYVLLVRKHALITSVAASVLLIAGWHYADGASSYLPMFFLGVLLAARWAAVQRVFAPLARPGLGPNLLGAGLLAVAVCALTSYFLIGRSIHLPGFQAREVTLPIVLAGVALLVVLVQTWPPLRRMLHARPFTFLGDISFSLYLVHLPIVVLALFVLHPGRLAGVVGTTTALLAAVLFFRFVERPAHRVARRVRARLHAESAQARAQRLPVHAGPAGVAVPDEPDSGHAASETVGI